MKRVLYFTGYRMVAQEWNGSRLASSVYFEPDEQGLDLFSSYLRSFSNQPVRLLVDLIEEEFRQIKIPFLRGSDRKAMLDRNFSKFFRNSEYRFAISQSMEKKTRKEERLLLIGLTNQHLLEPWLNVISDTKTPLSGIISLPLVSQSYVPKLEAEHRVTIMVSQQVPSNLRQSVFIDGKLTLSRLVPIASFYQGDYASDVLRDIESTQRYLISQRLVERSEKVSVHILTNKRHHQKLLARCEQETYFDFKIHEINQLLEEEKIQIPEEQDFSSALFCYLASKPLAINHYAGAHEKRYFQHYKANIGLKVASAILIALGFGMAAVSAANGLVYNQTTAETQLLEQKYRAKFNQLSESRIDSSTSTTTMQHVVDAVENISNNYLLDPEESLIEVSQYISLFPDLRVTDVDWFVTNFSGNESAGDVNWKRPNTGRRSSSRNQPGQPRPQRGFFEVIVMEAELLDFQGDFRYALSVVDDLQKALVESDRYVSVQVLKRPLDVESDNALSGDVGAGGRGQSGSATLEFRLVKEVQQNG